MNKKRYTRHLACAAVLSLAQTHAASAAISLSLDAELDMLLVAPVDQMNEGSGELALELSAHAQIRPTLDLLTTLTVDSDGIQLEEARLGWFLPNAMNLYVGRERLPFGTLNPLHDHDHLQVDNPQLFTHLLAEDGLVGDGGHLEYTVPFLHQDISFTLGLYEGLREDIGEGIKGYPWLGRVQSSFQCSEEKHDLVLGFSYLSSVGSKKAPENMTDAATMLDLRYTWSPQGDADQGLTLGGEYLHLSHGASLGKDQGLYLYAHWDMNASWGLGYRYDTTNVLFSSLEEGAKVKAHSVYGQWQPFEFVQIKLQYQHLEDQREMEKEHIVMLQSTFFFGWSTP